MRFSFFIFVILFSTAYAGAQTQAEVQGRVFWRGMIDDRVHLSIKGTTLSSKAVSGSTLAEGIYSFTAPLPDRDVTVEVVKKKGRSKNVRVIQQPSVDNDFTAVVEIHDDGGGAKEYQLEIFWR